MQRSWEGCPVPALPGSTADKHRDCLRKAGIYSPGSTAFGWAVYFLLSAIRVSEPVQSITQIAALGEIRISFKAVESLVTERPTK